MVPSEGTVRRDEVSSSRLYVCVHGAAFWDRVAKVLGRRLEL